MEEAKKPSYKYCMVPKCKNSIKNTPDKWFFRIPTDAKVRKQWCKMMRRTLVSPLSCLYCCEDHFNVKEDTANYIEYDIMKQQGEKCSLRLKKGIVPHIFLCQKRNISPSVVRMGVVKRQRLKLVNEALSEFSLKSSNISEIGETPHRSENEANPRTYTNVCDIHEAGSSTSYIEACDDVKAEPGTSYIIEDRLRSDKAVQVNIKPKYRSKSVNVNIQTKKNNVRSTPIKLNVLKRNLFDNAAGTSISSVTSLNMNQILYISSVENNADDKKHFKNIMCSGMEKEPKMLLGLP